MHALKARLAKWATWKYRNLLVSDMTGDYHVRLCENIGARRCPVLLVKPRKGNTFFRRVFLILLYFQASSIMGQADSPTLKLTDSIQLDESITYGKLINGLTYYIKSLPDSQDNVNLQLYVKAGISHQDPDQLNMAHFVEHMAFKSSDHFPNGIHNEKEMWKKLNMSQFDINGFVQSYHTKYTFNAPPDNEEALEAGLLWFRDIATRLHFKEEEIDTERGVLIQELIMRSGDNIQKSITRNKLQIKLFPCSQNYSNFVEHHRTLDSERLKQFYNDWYRPDLMSVVIVGKIGNVPKLEKQIVDQFSSIEPKENFRQVPDCDELYLSQPPKFAVVEVEDELQTNRLKTELYFRDRDAKKNISKIKGLKREKKIEILTSILNSRIKEKTEVPDAHFNGYIRYVRPTHFLVTLESKDDQKKAVQETIRAIRQLHEYGVLESEFKEAIDRQLRKLQSAKSDQHRYWLEGLEEHLVYGVAFPRAKVEIIRTWLSGYKLKAFNEFIKSLDLTKPEDIGILSPPDHDAFSEAQVRSWISSVGNELLSLYSSSATPKALMTQLEVKNLQKYNFENNGIGETGARELKLDNGMKVVLKSFVPTPGLFENKILIHAFSNKGAFDFPEKDYYSAVNSPGFIKNSGVGKFNKFELQRYLTTTSVSLPILNLYIKNKESGIKFASTAEELEQMLQMVYLYFTHPIANPKAFQDWKEARKLFYQEQLVDTKQLDLKNKINKLIGDVSEVPSGTERYLGLEKTDMNKGLEIYKKIFGNAQNFTFTLTGDFEVDSVIPLVNKYLGNLPGRAEDPAPLSVRNIPPSIPRGPLFIKFEIPETYSKVNYMYRPLFIVPTNGQVNWKDKIIAEALGKVLDFKVWNLRFQKGYSLYSVSGYSVFNENEQRHEFGAQFNCTPEEYPLLREEFHKIIKTLKSELTSIEVLEQGLKEMNSKYDPSGRAGSHEAVQQDLYLHYRFGVPWVDRNELQLFVKSITPKDVQKAAQNYFKEENLYEFVMMN